MTHQPTERDRRMVGKLVALGLPRDAIADVLEISRRTLGRYYAKELAVATVHQIAAVAQSLYNQAVSGDTRAAIFWLKCRAGWSEKRGIEENRRLNIVALPTAETRAWNPPDLSKLSDSALAELKAACQPREVQG